MNHFNGFLFGAMGNGAYRTTQKLTTVSKGPDLDYPFPVSVPENPGFE
jgi:hypothetical protein